jgi:N-acetyl-anhydromuramyl-L-alanine amidase AmpD
MDFIKTMQSPNYESAEDFLKRVKRPRKPNRIVLHTTEGRFPSDISYLCDPQPENPDKRVSSHFYVKRSILSNGKAPIYQLVDTANVAWHCGVSKPQDKIIHLDWEGWGPLGTENYDTIGIEAEAAYKQPMTMEQILSIVDLVLWLAKKYSIPLDRTHIVGHYEIKKTKIDPPDFDWNGFMTLLKRVPPPVGPDTPAVPNPIPTGRWFYQETGKSLQGGFFKFFNENGGLEVFGYPLTNEFVDTDGVTRQYFENAMLEWLPNNPAYPRFGAVGRRYVLLSSLNK